MQKSLQGWVKRKQLPMSVFSNDLVLSYILSTDNISIVSFPFTFHIAKYIFKVCILHKTYKYNPPFILSYKFCYEIKVHHFNIFNEESNSLHDVFFFVPLKLLYS